jgi:hypothetical protein
MFTDNHANTDDTSFPCTRSIVNDYLHWHANNQLVCHHRIYSLVRQIGGQCEITCRSQQHTWNISYSFTIDLQSIRHVHDTIGYHLFNDNRITWTRIIAFIAYSAMLVDDLIEQNNHLSNRIRLSMIDWTTDFIDIELHIWLDKQQHWVTFVIGHVTHYHCVFILDLGRLFRAIR